MILAIIIVLLILIWGELASINIALAKIANKGGAE